MTPRHDDWLSLPLVSYRGLWDKFDGPDTPGALRRAYRRGVPCIVRLGDDAFALDEAMAIWADAAINTRRAPLFLRAPTLPDLAGSSTDVRAIDAELWAVRETEPAQPSDMFRWTGTAWDLAGTYVPTTAPTDAIQPHHCQRAVVLFESANVILDLGRTRPPGVDDDAMVLRAIRSSAGPDTRIVRVSDLVELDQLDAGRREAA